MTAAVYRVNWLRADANYKRAKEEVTLVWHEMDWTIRFFKYHAHTWRSRQVNARSSSHLQYALRMESMWQAFALRAERSFNLVKIRFPIPTQELA